MLASRSGADPGGDGCQGGCLPSSTLSSATPAGEIAVVILEVASRRFGLPAEDVVRVLRVVAITPLPRAPEIVVGVVDLAGEILPVVDLRRRLGLETRPVRLSDVLVAARTGRRTVALLVDAAPDVVTTPPPATGDGPALPGDGLIAGAVTLPDGLVLVQDLGLLLSLDDEAALDTALAAVAETGA